MSVPIETLIEKSPRSDLRELNIRVPKLNETRPRRRLSSATAGGGLRRGGDDGDVPRRGPNQEDRGLLRDPLEIERLRYDRLQPEREGLRLGRGVAEPLTRAPTPTTTSAASI